MTVCGACGSGMFTSGNIATCSVCVKTRKDLKDLKAKVKRYAKCKECGLEVSETGMGCSSCHAMRRLAR